MLNGYGAPAIVRLRTPAVVANAHSQRMDIIGITAASAARVLSKNRCVCLASVMVRSQLDLGLRRGRLASLTPWLIKEIKEFRPCK